MNKETLLERITAFAEPHILDGIKSLSEKQLVAFYHELEEATQRLPKQLRQKLLQTPLSLQELKPYTPTFQGTLFAPCKEGEKQIASGKVGIVLLAGGQGTRLNSALPKGLFPLTALSHKTLFDLFFEKIKAASVANCQEFLVAVMLSSQNKEKTLAYFQEKNWFGLKKENVMLFEQHSLPLLNFQGDFLLETKGKLLQGPSGNGEVFHLMQQEKILERFEKAKVLSLEIFPIDNPLAFPFDPQLANLHMQGYEVIFKACEKQTPDEKVGTLCLTQDNIPYIAEYSEIPPQIANKKTLDAKLLFPIANTGLLSFSLSLIKRIVAEPFSQTFHKAYKKAKVFPNFQEQEVIKLESFIFDHLKLAKRSCALLYPKEEIFSPLKTQEDVKGIHLALSTLSKKILEKRYGLFLSNPTVEIDPLLFYQDIDPRLIKVEADGFVSIVN